MTYSVRITAKLDGKGEDAHQRRGPECKAPLHTNVETPHDNTCINNTYNQIRCMEGTVRRADKSWLSSKLFSLESECETLSGLLLTIYAPAGDSGRAYRRWNFS